jgi:competence protein ComEC
LVSIVITPLALLGMALLPFPVVGGFVLGLVCTATGWLLDALVPLAAPRFAIMVLAAPAWWATALASLAVVALLAPPRLPGRPAALAGLLPLFAAGDPLPAPGSMVVRALDVGQGSAILVETPGGRLLFDTGPRYGPELDAGARVVLPWLRSRGIVRLDGIVVSHADDDHAGGSESLLAGIGVDWLASPLPDEHPLPAAAADHYRCWRAMRWRWGETRFEFLHPGPERTTSQRSSTNANSCVLRIESPAGSVLLTGDIEAAQESFLVEKLGAGRLRADLLVAPHHGSNGSSTMPFLRAVAPRFAIAQAGYRNRFGHPGDKALVRYRAAGIEMLRTDRDGAVSVTLRGPGQPVEVLRQRRDLARYWRIRVDDGAAADRPP